MPYYNDSLYPPIYVGFRVQGPKSRVKASGIWGGGFGDSGCKAWGLGCIWFNVLQRIFLQGFDRGLLYHGLGLFRGRGLDAGLKV